MAEAEQTKDFADKPSALEFEVGKVEKKLSDFWTGANIGAPQPPPGLPIDVSKQPDKKLSVDTPKSAPPLPTQELAQKRAEDASWALEGHTVQSKDELTNAIMSGKENEVRQITSIEDSQIRTQDVLAMPTYDQKTLLKATTPVLAQYFWEHKYAQKIASTILNGDLKDAADELAPIRRDHPELTEAMFNRLQEETTFNLYAQKKYKDLDELTKKSGWLSWGGSILKDIVVPAPYQAYKETGTLKGAVLPGAVLTEQAYDLFNRPVPERMRIFEARVRELAAQDLYRAKDYIESVLDHSQSSKYLRDALNLGAIGAQVAFPGFVGRALIKGAKAATLQGLAISALRTTAQNAATKPAAVVSQVAAGNTLGAGLKDVSRVLFKKLNPKYVEPPEAALDRLHTVLDVRNSSPLYNSYGLIKEAERRVYELAMSNLANFIIRIKNMVKLNDWHSVLKDPYVVQGIYEEAVENGQYAGVAHRLLDYGNPIIDPGTNTAVLPSFFGRHDTTPFKSINEARSAITSHGMLAKGRIIEVEIPGQTKVKMQGLSAIAKQVGRGWVVQINQPIRRDSKWVDLALEAGKGLDKPDYILKKWASRFVGPENTMAFADVLERKMVTYMPNYLMQTILDSVADIRELGASVPGLTKRKLMKDWMRITKLSQSRRNPATGKPGHWYENAGELQTDYQSLFGRQATDLEVGAYFGLKNAFDMDWVARNARVFSELHNAGFKKLVIKVLDSGANWMTNRKYTTSQPFHGRAIPELPHVGNTAIFGPNIDDMEILKPSKVSAVRRATIADMVKRGEVKIFELHDWHNTPLQGFGLATDKHMIHYVVVKNAEEHPLDAVQVPYTGAGHLMPKSKFKMVQPHMRLDSISGLSNYVGDTMFGMVHRHAEGKAFEKHLDELQRLTREGKHLEARQYHLDNNIPWGGDEWEKWTRGKKNQQGKYEQPMLNLKDPIRVIPMDTSYIDSVHGEALKQRYGDKFVDINKTGAFRHTVPFTQERDMQELRELRNEGSVNNPLWKFEHAELVDPLQSLTRGINAIIRSQWMDDHKVNTIKRWLDYGIKNNLFQVSAEDVRKSPFYYFNKPEQLFRKGADPIAKNFMDTNHQKIKLFTGINSRTESMTHNFIQRQVDWLYDNGHKWASDKLINIWDWAEDHDPMRLMRSMVFHKSLGLFSVPIMFLHAATAANTAMLTHPRHWARGMSSVWLHGMASFNRSDKFLNHLDKVASGMGWRPGEWLHSYHMTSEVPFLQEPGTYALHEEAMSSRLIPTMWGKFLHAGLAPFNFGLKMMRSYAWYTAMSEFRHGGGGTFNFKGHIGAMGADHVQQVLARADLLAHNMTRASASYLNTGWRATPMQFMTYHTRLIDLAIGKQTTKAEKSRFFAGNLMLYGIGGPLSLYSLGMADLLKDWNQSAIANGYQPGKNGVSDFFLRGLPAMVLSYMSGEGDNRYWYNIADRFGPKGLAHQFIGHYARENQGIAMDMADLLGGPLVSTTQDMLTAFNPFWRAITSMFDSGSEGEPRWHVTTGHVMAAFRRISSINNAYTGYYAARYGQWFTREGGTPVETDIPTIAAIFMFATGSRSQEQVDMYAKQRIMNEDKAAGQSIMLEMRTLMERASEAAEQGNNDEADSLYEDAFALEKGLNYSEQRQIIRMIREDSQIKATDNAYYNPKRVPIDQQDELSRQRTERGF